MTPAELDLLDLSLITEDDLPHSDDEVMETARHGVQISLLVETLRPWLTSRPDGGYTAGDMFVYYSPKQVKNEDFKGPDFYAAVGVSSRERKSWVCWQEGKPPDIVIELLSESTASFDKKQKKQVYQDRLQVPYYVWYDPWNSLDWAGFELRSGAFVNLSIDAQGQMFIPRLGLSLVRWTGIYQDIEAIWLRWADPIGVLLPTEAERRIQAQAEADRAVARAAQVESQLLQTVQNLRQMGMSVEQIAQITGLSIDELNR